MSAPSAAAPSATAPAKRSRRWRQTIRELPAQVFRTVAPRRTIKVRGLRFTLPCDNRITEWRWRTFKTGEPETLDWIDRWVKDGTTLFDIGANVGVFSIYAALRSPGARIVAFEPEYANLHVLKDNLIANGVQERVDVYSIALGSRTGISRLHIQDTTPGAALHTESKETLDQTRTHKPVVWREGVYAMTLDAFCEETRITPDCVKMDVDGTEREILDGARQILRTPTLRSMIMEMFGGPEVREACAQVLQGNGLRRAWADPGKSDNEIWVREGAERA